MTGRVQTQTLCLLRPSALSFSRSGMSFTWLTTSHPLGLSSSAPGSLSRPASCQATVFPPARSPSKRRVKSPLAAMGSDLNWSSPFDFFSAMLGSTEMTPFYNVRILVSVLFSFNFKLKALTFILNVIHVHSKKNKSRSTGKREVALPPAQSPLPECHC